MSTLSSVMIFGIFFLFFLCFCVRLGESEIASRHLGQLFGKWAQRPLAEKLFILVFVVMMVAYGGSKPTNSVPEGGGENTVVVVNPGTSGGTGTVTVGDGNTAVVVGPGAGAGGTVTGGATVGDGMNAGTGGANTLTGPEPQRLTTNQYAAGFALVSAATNAAAPWLALPSNGTVHPAWTRYGVADDTFWLPTNGWAFILGTNAVDGVHVSSSGTLSFGRPKGSPRAAEMPDGTNINFFAPLQGQLGIVPPQGRFWHAVSPSNSLLCTWQNVCAGRDSNSVVCFQAELFWNGDFAYRYAFTNAPALTNFVIGAQNRGGGETYALDDTNRFANGLELHWRAFGVLDPGVEDHDGDGLSTYDEVMLYGTNPSLKDSDRDGLEDAAELAAGTGPLNPDSDGDGLADGIDPQPTVWNDTGAVIPNSGGLTSGYVILNGLNPATNWTLDSDNDGWPDWKEALAGTSPTDPFDTPMNADGSCKLFEATITLGTDLPCPVVLNAGGYTLVLQKAGSWTLILKEGEAYNLTLTASQPCAVSLSCSLTSAFAALQDASAAFSGCARLPGGVPTACGVIAQPTVCVTPEPPERVCFHSEAPKTVAAKVSPAMAGAYQWHWYGGGISSASGKSANISWDGGDSYVYLSFTASGAAQPRFAYREVTKCSKVDDDTWCDDHGCEHWYCACDNADASDDDDCGFHGQKVSKCRAAICPTHHCPYDECPDGWCHQHDTWYSDCGEWWCHMHECYLSECNHEWYDPGHDPGEGGGGSAEEEEPDPDPGEPVFGSCDESLAAVNNDDDDASSAEDSGESPVAGENDLVAVWPLGYFDGQCCPCPEHHVPPDGSQSAELESCSTRLALWADAAKTSAQGDTVNAGQAVWVEGQTASTSVGADRIVWKWTDEENHVHRVTNAFTVLSVRLFGDVNLDGQVDAADKALHPLLSHEYGWGMPAATNVFHPVVLRTDVGLSGGVYTLALSGPSGMCRIWTTGSPASTNSPLLVCGQTVTNGVNGVYFLSGADSELYVEAVDGGSATLTYQYVGTGGAEGLSCAASMKLTAFKVGLIEDGTTVYNFSPSLGETAQVKATITPEPPSGGIQGHQFKVEIVRETTGGDQHIDWLDVTDESGYGWARSVDFASRGFTWDGIPDVFGDSVSQATGLDVFTGLVANVSRVFPPVTLDQPVPPPLYTAVASIRRNSDGAVMCEARKRIFVQQVVKITYDADAVTMTKLGYVINTNGVPTYLISPMSDTEWNAQRARILTIAQANYNAVGANVRFVDANATVAQPYSFLNMEYSAGPLGFAPADYLNVLPNDSGTLCSYLESSALNYYLDNPTMAIPITANEIGNMWGHVVAHECGHLFGLVAPGDVLDGSQEETEGDASGWHNRNPAGLYVMNPGGGTNMLMQITGRTGSWSWKSRNAKYLKFVLPKE